MMGGLRRLVRAGTASLLLGASALVLSTTDAIAEHEPDVVSEPAFPAPGGTTVVSAGDSKRAVGQLRNYSLFDDTAFKHIAWGPNSAASIGAAFDGAIDEPGETLSFDSMASNLPGGVARWTGSAAVPLANMTEPVYQTRLTLTATDTSPSPVPLPFTRSTDLPVLAFNGVMPVSAGDNGAVLLFGGDDYRVNVLWEMSSDGVMWGPLLDVYDTLSTPDPGPVVQTSFGAGFFTTQFLPPDPVTNIDTAPAAPGEISLSWDAAHTNGKPITDYTVTSDPGGLTCSTATLGCTVSGLTNGVEYLFSVVATNVVGSSSPSLAGPDTPVGPPGAPTLVSGVPKSKAIVASWVAPTSDGGAPISGYTAKATPSGKTCTTTGALTCKITGLVNGTNYTVTVRATNDVGNGPFSAPSATVKPFGKPGAPRNVVAAPKDRKLAVAWDAPTSNGGSPITAYKAIASPSGKSCSTTGAKACVIGGLTNGTAYTVRVKAKNAAGFGPLSAPSAPKRPKA